MSLTVVRDDVRMQKMRRISQFISVFGLTVLVIGMLISIYGNPSLFVMQWALLLVGLVCWQISMNFAYKYVRSPRQDELLDEGLKKGSYKSYLYHYVLPSADHVLLTRSGPVVMVPQMQTGSVSVGGEDGDKWRWKTKIWRRILGQEPRLGNPTKTAARSIEGLVMHIKEKAPELEELPIGAIIVFTAPKHMISLDLKESRLPATHVSELKKLIRKHTGRALPPEQYNKLREIFDDSAEFLTKESID